MKRKSKKCIGHNKTTTTKVRRNPAKEINAEDKVRAALAPLFDRSNRIAIDPVEREKMSQAAIKGGNAQIIAHRNAGIHPSQRISYNYMPSDFCNLIRTYSKDQFNFLLDCAIESKNNFRVFVKALITYDFFKMYSLGPQEIINLRKPQEWIEILYDPMEPPMCINSGFLWGSKIEADLLLASFNVENLHSISPQSPSFATKLRYDQKKPSVVGHGAGLMLRALLEEILIARGNSIFPLKKPELWSALLYEIENNPASKFEISKPGLRIKEKQGDISWDKESAKYHLNIVIKWYKNSEKSA